MARTADIPRVIWERYVDKGLKYEVSTRASGEMADALASGASVRKDVGVQVPPRAPFTVAKGLPSMRPVTLEFSMSIY